MLFNVAQLLQEPVGSERLHRLDDILLGVRGEGGTPVGGSVRFVRTNRGILAYASVEATVEDTCSRCLGPARMEVQAEIAEEFIPTVDVHTGQLVPAPEDDGDGDSFRIDEHHHLDLSEAVRQALVAAEPMRALCRQECAGLCATCGADLNTGPCGCPLAPADDRWATLRSLQLTEN